MTNPYGGGPYSNPRRSALIFIVVGLSIAGFGAVTANTFMRDLGFFWVAGGVVLFAGVTAWDWWRQRR